MKYRPLGRSALQVSVLCLGTMNFGPETSEEDSHEIMDRAHEVGINFFDTANVYGWQQGEGITEQIIGRWFAQGGGRREKTVVATKLYGSMSDWPNDTFLSARNIRHACDASLRRLQTDYIDLYQLHWPSRNVPIFGNNAFDPAAERPSVAIEDTLAALGKLVDEGKIRHIGVSNESSWGVSEFIKQSEMKGLPRIATIQNLYNLTARLNAPMPAGVTLSGTFAAPPGATSLGAIALTALRERWGSVGQGDRLVVCHHSGHLMCLSRIAWSASS